MVSRDLFYHDRLAHTFIYSPNFGAIVGSIVGGLVAVGFTSLQAS